MPGWEGEEPQPKYEETHIWSIQAEASLTFPPEPGAIIVPHCLTQNPEVLVALDSPSYKEA